MQNCDFCQTEISASDLERGSCPFCLHALKQRESNPAPSYASIGPAVQNTESWEAQVSSSPDIEPTVLETQRFSHSLGIEETQKVEPVSESGQSEKPFREMKETSPLESKQSGFQDHAPSPLAQAVNLTVEWDALATWNFVEKQPATSPLASLKTPVSETPNEASNLVICRRRIKRHKAERFEETDFELLSLLGKGGMGMVFSARQASLDRTVAVKMILPDVSQAGARHQEFLTEACVTGDLEHPNIVPIYELGQTDKGAFFYAMKCVQGTPWKNVIAQKSLPENLEILLRVSDAVAFAHSRGIVHRDLKPENIMLGGFGEVLVMDWGLAMPTDLNRSFGGMRFRPTMGGTPAFMAPEMATGPLSKIGPASDIYLLGAILYQIITGKTPHSRDSARECLLAAARNEIGPTEVQGELIDIAYRAMRTLPLDRYESVLAFQGAIREYQAHSESIRVADHAVKHLQTGRELSDYGRFNRAIFGFQEALDLWSENKMAQEQLVEAKFDYASIAKQRGDFELGLGLLDASLPAHQPLIEDIQRAKSDREIRQRRLQTYKRLGLALAAAFMSSVCIGAYWINLERNEAVYQKGIAEQNQTKAIQQYNIAEQQRKIAEQQRNAAEDAREQERIAKELEQEATKRERRAREDEIKAKEAEAYEAYVARIGAAAGKIDVNAYDQARELLWACMPQNPDAKDYRNWEWGRLWFLCQQSSQVMHGDAAWESLAVKSSGDQELEWIAAGSATGKISIWDRRGKLQRTLDVGNVAICALAISPSGEEIAVGTSDPSDNLKILNARTGAVLRSTGNQSADSHRGHVLSIAYSKDGNRLLTTAQDGMAKVWSAPDLEHQCTLHGHRWWVWKAKFCDHSTDPRKSCIVTVSQDGSVIVWNDATGGWKDKDSIKSSPRFDAHRGPVYAVTHAPQRNLFATAGQDGRILLWKQEDLQAFDYQNPAAFKEPEFVVLGQHQAAVRDLEFSPDGNLLVSAGNDNALRIWDIETRKELKTLRGHGQWVAHCRFTENGATVASAAQDGTVRLWDIGKYAEIRVLRGKVLEGHEDAVLAANFSADSQTIVTASRDRTLKTWSTETGAELRSLQEGHLYLASNAVFFDDGKRLATAAVDNSVRIWDVATGGQIDVLHQTGRGAAIAVSPDNKLLLTGGPREATDKGVFIHIARVIGLETKKDVFELKKHRAQVTCASISPDGKLCFTGDADGEGCLWDLGSGTLLKSLNWHSAKIIAAKFGSDSNTLTTASAERAVVNWDLEKGSIDSSAMLTHSSDLVAADIGSQANIIVTATKDNTIHIWDAKAKKLNKTISVDTPPGDSDAKSPIEISHVALSQDESMFLVVNQQQSTIRVYRTVDGEEIYYPNSASQLASFLMLPKGVQLWSATFDPFGKRILSVGGDQIKLWDIDRDRAPQSRLRLNFSAHGVVASANFSADGKQVVSGSWDGTANVWEVTTGKAKFKLVGGHTSRINDARYSRDKEETYILTSSDDGTTILWDARMGQLKRRFGTGESGITCSDIAIDLKRLATAGRDGVVRIWSTEASEQPLHNLVVSTEPVYHVAFSPSGLEVASGGADNAIHVWDVATGERKRTLRGHTAAVTSVTWSPDGLRIFSGSEDFSAKIWDPVTGKELLTLKAHSREVASVAFANSKPFALTGSLDGTAIVWEALPWRSVNTLSKRVD